jgi:hypothetical protein
MPILAFDGRAFGNFKGATAKIHFLVRTQIERDYYAKVE